METTEIETLPLEKVIKNKLVQNNVTEQILAALKDKYGGLRLASLDDKESYLELKLAARDCAKVRTLTVKLCKEGREDALKIQKLWIQKEKEIVGKVAEVEDVLDAEIKKYDDEVKRKEDEEEKRKKDAAIQRQAALTRMGATYDGQNWTLGETSYDSVLIEQSSPDVWEEAILPKFQSEYQKIEHVRIEEENKKQEAAAEMKRQKEEFAKEQEEFRRQKAEMERQKEQEALAELQKQQAEERRVQQERNDLHQKRFQKIAPLQPSISLSNLWEMSDDDFDAILENEKSIFAKREEEKNRRIQEQAAQQERERIAEEQRVAEEKRLQEEAKKQEELAQASDKVKFADLIKKVAEIKVPDMRSGQYRKKTAIIREKLEEILAL
jgi:hypothetical protein